MRDNDDRQPDNDEKTDKADEPKHKVPPERGRTFGRSGVERQK